MSDVVATLAEADLGSRVFMFDAQRSLYMGREFKGRGVWTVETVTGLTRQSLLIGRSKFDRATGRERGDHPWPRELCGVVERRNRETLGRRHNIADAVLRLTDVDALLKIAEIAGVPAPAASDISERR